MSCVCCGSESPPNKKVAWERLIGSHFALTLIIPLRNSVLNNSHFVGTEKASAEYICLWPWGCQIHHTGSSRALKERGFHVVTGRYRVGWEEAIGWGQLKCDSEEQRAGPCGHQASFGEAKTLGSNSLLSQKPSPSSSALSLPS